ncbi:hypothetical protein [Luteimonas sp. R10]|uniref:hypothetical protein n=1 Tax=Luteimonas sp. R10 TaxID=3108176 RepID=UPI00308E5210|nr:hypothetical protein U3649_14835 [Luteimonas sp. R10]
MNKQRMRQVMLGLEADGLCTTMDAYREYFASARLDRSEPVEIDEHAQAVSARELAEAVDHPLHDHAENLETLRNADFGPKSVVEEGAVVRIGGRNLVVAVPTVTFVCDGEEFMGISARAPIFEAMQGKRAGESFCFNGRNMVVEFIA